MRGLRGSLLILAWTASAVVAQDSLVKVEPPSPTENRQTWNRVRGEQRSLSDTLKLWGISASFVSAEKLETKSVPGLVTAKIGMTAPNQLDLSMELGFPRNPSGVQFSAAFDLTKRADASSLAAKVKLTIRGTGISTKGKWSAEKGLELEGGAAWDHALYTIGVKIDTAGGASGTFTFKLGPARVKVDPKKWVQRAQHFLPQLKEPLAAAAQAAIPKVGGVLIQFDLGRMARAMSDQPPAGLGSVVLVSLKRAIKQGGDLGVCTRITGVLVDHRASDVILIGVQAPEAPTIPIGLVAEVFRSVHRDGLAPWVSIDPISLRDPNPRHRARFGGVSAGLEQSMLLKVLLDADYAFKEFQVGGRRVPGVKSYFDLEVEDSTKANPIGISRRIGGAPPMDRIWFTPRQPGVGEIWRLTAADGALYVFPSGVKIQTESMRVSDETGTLMLAGGGTGNPLAQRSVLACTREYDRLERAMPELRQVRQVFQLAIAAAILRSEKVRSPVLDALAQLPLKPTPHRKTFAGVGPRRIGVTQVAVWGGVEIHVRLGRARFRAVAELGTALEGIRKLAWATPTIRAYGVLLPVAREARVANHVLMSAQLIDAASRDLAAGDLPSAQRNLSKALEADPSSALAYDQLGMVRYRMKDHTGAVEAWSRAIAIDPTPAVHYKRGVVLANTNRWREAAADFQATVKADPSHAPASFNLGKAKEGLGDPRGAVEAYSRALAADSRHKGSLLNRGRLRKKLGDSPGAMRDYSTLLEIDPSDKLGYFNRGLLRKKLGDLPGAIADFTKGIELDPKDRDARYMRALVHRIAGHHLEAVVDYTEAIRLVPGDVQSTIGRAITYAYAGRRPEALKDIDRVLAWDPKNRRARALAAMWRAQASRPRPPGDAVDWANAGSAAARRGDYESAIHLFSLALGAKQLDGEQAGITLINRSMMWRDMGLFDQAVADAVRATGLLPGHAEAHLVLGSAHRSAGDIEKALAGYTEAIRLRPDHAVAFSNRALVYEQLGKREQAVADYRKALAARPSDVVAASALHRLTGEPMALARPADPSDVANAAMAAGQRGDYKEAERLYTRAIDSGKLSPNHAALAYYSRGIVHINLQRFDDALADLRRAIKMVPTYADAHVGLGNAYLGKNEPTLAVAAYTEAVRRQPRHVLGYRNRAQAYEQLGRKEEAKADYQKVLELLPDDAFANAALRRLSGG